jgi:Fe-S-cluster containining protein
MKYLETDEIDQCADNCLGANDTFKFRCYPGIDCFNLCCRNLNLYLYPYDVIRLKQRLAMSSNTFLDRYVDVVLRQGNHFPAVLLRMAQNAEQTCPFVSETGCTVYEDRPDSCRTFPLEQAMEFRRDQRPARVIHLFRPPDFCLGQHETQVWTPQTYAQDQAAEPYHRMTARWADTKRLFQSNPYGGQGFQGPKAKMAFMATYNMDAFREFVFQSSFKRRYKIKADMLKKARTDDVALLKLGLAWVRWFLWGIPSRVFKPRR